MREDQEMNDDFIKCLIDCVHGKDMALNSLPGFIDQFVFETIFLVKASNDKFVEHFSRLDLCAASDPENIEK